MFGSSYGIGPLASDSFNAGIGDIEQAFMQANAQPSIGEEEEVDETQMAQGKIGGDSMENFEKILGALGGGQGNSMAENMMRVGKLFMGGF